LQRILGNRAAIFDKNLPPLPKIKSLVLAPTRVATTKYFFAAYMNAWPFGDGWSNVVE
jgi:hypothetical protein